jgi:adenine-specific DNA-methyltransferase
VTGRYDHLSKDELARLLEARDRRDATRFGLVWEANEIERDQAINSDFVALDLLPEKSIGAAPWRNLIIEGDNFDALRSLRMTHAGQVKCIYIDPPYNTGNRDFVYNDHFVDVNDSWRHSMWVEFMYQRLMLAKELLTQDGVIFVSIDDNEVFGLGLLMNRVFGPNAFVANCIWQKRYSRENRGSIGDAHEYVLVYANHPDVFKETSGRIALTEEQAKVYKNPNNDPMGRWRAIPMTAQGFRPNQMYEIKTPSGAVHHPPEGRCWSMTEPEFLKLKAKGRIWFGKNENSQPGVIRYLSEVEGLVPWTWWPHDEVGHTDEARKEIREWLDTQTAFQTPKPLRLMERILQIGCGKNDLVLDFFAGSGTTAHAALKLNAEDGGNRRFILVSSTEATIDEPDKNVCRDVCARRIERVIAGYGDNPGLGGDFAYLRARRIAPGQLLEIEHAQVWTALQMIHRDTLEKFASAEFLWTGDGDEALAYVPRFTTAIVPALRKAVRQSDAVTLYSWQPETLRQHIRSTHVQHEAIPESLARRFGMKG